MTYAAATATVIDAALPPTAAQQVLAQAQALARALRAQAQAQALALAQALRAQAPPHLALV
jgi:F0F1-type ATP synthase membrane subunit b/b'